MGFLSGILDLLFPPKCIFCRRVLPYGKRGICASCAKALVRDNPPRTGKSFTCCYAPLLYEETVRDALIRFKFKDQSGYATEFGELLADCIRTNLQGKYDLITWVPVSPQRLSQRGYDQSMLLAMAAALKLDDVAVETLKKSRDNPAQSSLAEAAERRSNVLGAYEAADPELIAGKRLLLIDDIITTGATLEEASRTLLAAGAKEVFAAAVAQTSAQTTLTKEELS